MELLHSGIGVELAHRVILRLNLVNSVSDSFDLAPFLVSAVGASLLEPLIHGVEDECLKSINNFVNELVVDAGEVVLVDFLV